MLTQYDSVAAHMTTACAPFNKSRPLSLFPLYLSSLANIVLQA
jgi:hypothetical protein